MPKWKHTKENLSWMEFSCTIEKLVCSFSTHSKKENANYLVHCRVYRSRNKKTHYSLWFFHSLTMPSWQTLHCFGTHEKQRECLHGPPPGTVRIKGCCMWKFFGIYKQGHKTMPLGWKRTHCIKESKWIFKDKDRTRNLLLIYPYFFSCISLHFQVTA